MFNGFGLYNYKTNMEIKKERTFLLIKPDGVDKNIIGEIIKRLEDRDLKVVALEMVRPTFEKFDEYYPKSDEWIIRLGNITLETFTAGHIDPVKAIGTDDPKEIGTKVRERLLEYMTSAPVVKLIVEGEHAVGMARKIVGTTMPHKADMGSIRGDYSDDSPALAHSEKRAIMNLVHASDTEREAKDEIAYWFDEPQIFNR